MHHELVLHLWKLVFHLHTITSLEVPVKVGTLSIYLRAERGGGGGGGGGVCMSIIPGLMNNMNSKIY